MAVKKKAVKKKVVKKKVAEKKVVKKKVVKKKVVKKKVVKKKVAEKKVVKKKVVKKKVAEEKVAEKKAPKVLSARQITLKRLLVEQRKNILKEAQTEIASYIKGENRQLVETALDDGDWSVIDLSEDISFRKLGTHRQTLLKIDEALRKIDENTYGICEDCGEKINSERLKILPSAIFCRDCQEKREELEAVEKWEGSRYRS